MAMARSRGTQIIGLYLMGPTASGKMQVANLIAGTESPAFHVTPHRTPATPIPCELLGTQFTVVTSFGLGNQEGSTCQNFVDSVELFLNQDYVQIRLFLLVLKYNEPLKSEYMKRIQAAKNILGENVLRDYTLVVLIGGRDFERDHRREDFDEWCRGQPDENLRMLLSECQGRAQLIGNRGRFETGLLRQKQELIDKIVGLSEQHSNVGYSREDYNRANDSRQIELASSMEEEVETRTYRIWSRLDGIKRQRELWEQLEELNHLKTEAEDIIRDIRRHDRGTGILILSNALLRAQLSHRSVQEAISSCLTLTPFNHRINSAQRDISNISQSLRWHDICILLLAGVCLCLLLCFYNNMYGLSLLIGWLSYWVVVCKFFCP